MAKRENPHHDLTWIVAPMKLGIDGRRKLQYIFTSYFCSPPLIAFRNLLIFSPPFDLSSIGCGLTARSPAAGT